MSTPQAPVEEQLRVLSSGVAELHPGDGLAERQPDPADRRGVFVDFGQNTRDRTIATAYSVRPTQDARVSAPLLWDEVATVDPAAFTVQTMRDRVAAVGDPTAGMWSEAVSLGPLFAAFGLR